MGLVDGKAAFVTGAGSGIGRSIARLLAAEGARVAACDVDEAGVKETAAQIEGGGGEAIAFATDVTREDDVARAVERCVDAFGRIDCAVNNAGISGTPGAIQDVDFAAWQRTLDINLSGVFLCLKYELPRMVAQGGGAIVNVASGAGLIAVPLMSPYCASKHAVLGLTKTAAVENARTGVRVNAVCPGSTDTPMIQATIAGNAAMEKMILRSMPGGRLGEPDEVAQAAVWLCSDRASFVSGESMLVDGASIAR